jgi:hypothetical protein
MLSGLSLARCISIQISVTPSEMVDGLITVFKRSNGTSFMIRMAYEMDVVDDNHLYQTCLITLACLV